MAASVIGLKRAVSMSRLLPTKHISPFASPSSIRQPFALIPSSSIRNNSSQVQSTLEPPEYLNEAERQIFDKIIAGLQPSKLEVQDISGGCGSMYALDVVSSKFQGLPIIKQHKMVNTVLADEIKKWHGVQLKTKAP